MVSAKSSVFATWAIALSCGAVALRCSSHKGSDRSDGKNEATDVGGPATPGIDPKVASGEELYSHFCASCHGALAVSAKRGATLAQLDGAIESQPAMKTLAMLDQAARERIVAALSDSPGNQGPDGAALYGRYCALCHGELNVSAKAGRSAQAIKDAIASEPGMNSLGTLGEAEIAAIAAALSTPIEPIVGETDAEKGARYYGQLCASCHNTLEVTKKPNRTAAQITQATVDEPYMKGLASAVDKFPLIELALKREAPPSSSQTALLLDNRLLKSRLFESFTNDATSQTTLSNLVRAETFGEATTFGGPCTRYEVGCLATAETVYLPTVPLASPLRAGRMSRACLLIANNGALVRKALTKAGIDVEGKAEVSSETVGKLASHFRPAGAPLSAQTLEAVVAKAQVIAFDALNTPAEARWLLRWQFVVAGACSSLLIEEL